MTQDAIYKQLHDAIALDCDMAMNLVDILTEEQSCLIRFNADSLVSLSQKKESLMLELEARFRGKITEAEALGLGQGVDALVARMAEAGLYDSRIPLSFKTFQSTMQQAQRLNDLNGTLVAEQLQSLQARVQILIDNARPAVAGTYGPDGAMASQQGTPTMSRVVVR